MGDGRGVGNGGGEGGPHTGMGNEGNGGQAGDGACVRGLVVYTCGADNVTCGRNASFTKCGFNIFMKL